MSDVLERVLVTGATGHLGSAVCTALAEDGLEVVGVDMRYRRDLPATIEVADLLDTTAVYRLLDGCDAVVHLANHPNAHRGPGPQRLFSENVAMNMNVFQAAHEAGIRRLVYSSSVQAFSGTSASWDHERSESCLSYLPIDGDAPPCPRNAYALSKVVGEQQLRYYAWLEPEASCTAVRFPSLPSRRHIEWYRRHAHGGHPHPHGNPDEGFSYLLLEDAGTFVREVLRKMGPGYHQLFPTAPPDYMGKSVPELVEEFFPNVPLRVPLEEMDGLVDMSRIRAELDWEPTALDLLSESSGG
jgi:nucleoside-diphosphate-sugar epimerase